MKHLILLTQAILVLLFLNSCKKNSETTTTESSPQKISDTAWLKLSPQSSSNWMSLFQNGIQDIGFEKADNSLIIVTNDKIVKLSPNYEVANTYNLLENIHFCQIRLSPQNNITYSYAIYNGSVNGRQTYIPGFCTQYLGTTQLQTQKGFVKDSSSSIDFALVSIDNNFRIFKAYNGDNTKNFVRVQLLNDFGTVVRSTDITNVPNTSNYQVRAFNIKDNIGIIIGDAFYQLTTSGQLSNPILFPYTGKEIAPYNDGLLISDENNQLFYHFHTASSQNPFSDYIISGLKTSINEEYTLVRRSKLIPGEAFVGGEFIFINNQTQKEYSVKNSSIRIEDIKAFWITNNTINIISTDGIFARLLK